MYTKTCLILVAVCGAFLGYVSADDCQNCSPAVYCIHGERKLKDLCTLQNGAEGVCCDQLPKRNEFPTVISNQCIQPPNCNSGLPDRYRRADGSCTSQRDVRLGMVNTAYLRLMPPAYVDNQWSPVGQPPPRSVSSTVFIEGDRPHPTLALSTAYWGQFIAHDLTFAASATKQNGSDIECCSQDGVNFARVPSNEQPQCIMPVEVSPQDPFYRAANVHCMNFVRTALGPNNCFNYGAGDPSVAHQINQATHYLDGSVLYGSTDQTQQQLRSHQGGRLRVLRENGRDILPLGSDSECAPDSGGCFVAGDPRVNQIIPLASLHMLLVREHNRVADVLSSRHPNWNDETVFQEARLIVSGEIQHITYFEWLPDIVGPGIYNLLNKYNPQNGYVPQTELYNPSISSEFGAAAFRYGHSTIDGRMNLPPANPNGRTENNRLSDFFFRSGRLRERGFFDRILHWLVETRMQEVDRFLTTELQGFLDKTVRMPQNQLGFDLTAFNIQRGRDFGVRRYIDYRYWLGNRAVTGWSDLEEVMDRDMVALLSRAYSNPGDIDLYVGGLLERHAPGAAVGPTFQAIIIEQFSRTFLGDRKFYLNSKALSANQIREIQKASFARLICDNSDNIPSVPRYAFRVPSGNNQIVKCTDIPSVNLAYWT